MILENWVGFPSQAGSFEKFFLKSPGILSQHWHS